MTVKKTELQAGMIVWLCKPVGIYHRELSNDHHGGNDEHGFLGIDLAACGRPVVIIDMIPENDHRVWVCPVSSPLHIICLLLTSG